MSVPRSGASGALTSLRLLLVTVVIVPLALLAAVGWLSYRATVARAKADIAQDVAIAREHAANVIDTHQLVAMRVNDLVGNLDDAEIRAHEKQLHDTFRNDISGLPQVRSIAVFGRDGHMLVSTRTYPVDSTLQFRDRDSLIYLQDPARTLYVSGLREGRSGGGTFFTVARRKERVPGEYDGMIAVTVSPDYFTAFYEKLVPNDDDYADGLLRADGASLAHFPRVDADRLAALRDDELLAAVRDNPHGGIFEGRSDIDGVMRIIAYQRADPYALYVTEGRSVASIVAEWRGMMLPFAAVVVATTLALVLLTLLALRRTRREQAALAQAHAEIGRREQAEEALRQSQKMEAVGQLTGGVAHDFNNLLTVVMGNLETLRGRLRNADADVGRLIDGAMRGAVRGAALTQKLLAFSRRQPLDPAVVDLNRLVEDMSDLLARTLGERIAIKTALAGGLWRSFADPNQLENALLNLAVNARDAMASGGTLTIETANVTLDEAYAATHEELVPGPYVMVAVSDTGTGMAKEVAARVFEPFFTTKPMGQGTGLGLSQVYGFVKQSGGHVQVYSELGAGTTVKLYLPQLRAVAAAGTGTKPARAAPQAARGETILLVEDDDDVRALAGRILRADGYRVLEAADAVTALRALRQQGDIRLLLTDVGLPGALNGRQLADEAQRAAPALKVLFTSGYARNAIAHQGRLDPGVELIVKPFNAASLIERVRRMLA